MKYQFKCKNCNTSFMTEKVPLIKTSSKNIAFNRVRKKSRKAANRQADQVDIAMDSVSDQRSSILTKVFKTRRKSLNLQFDKLLGDATKLYRVIDNYSKRRPEKYIDCPICKQPIYLY